MKNIIKEIIFFLIIFILYYLMCQLSYMCITNNLGKLPYEIIYLCTGLLFISIIIAIFYLGGINKLKDEYTSKFLGKGKCNPSLLQCSDKGMIPENSQYLPEKNSLFEVAPAKLCAEGGWYMNQGDSTTAKTCQKFYNSKEGQKQMDQFHCSNCGYQGLFHGLPANHMKYTPQSGDDWKNKQCSELGSISPNGIF
jgi:hypothetical protein